MAEYERNTERIRGTISAIVVEKCDAETAVSILNHIYKMRAEYENRIAGLTFILTAALVVLVMLVFSELF